MVYPRIGVIVGEIQGQYQSKLVHGINKQARNLGYDVLIYHCFVKGFTESDFEQGEQYFLNLVQFDLLDGIIVIGDTIKWKGAMEKLIAALQTQCTCPVVFIDYSEGHSYDVVRVDDVYPFERIVDHLVLEHHCKHILFYSGPMSVSTTVTRLEGYRRSLKKHHLEEFEDICLEANYWKESGASIARKIINGERPKPDAIILCGDDMAVGAVEEFVASGWKLPSDIIVMGYDGSANAIKCTPSVTSYSPPVEAAGENAVFTLDARIRKVPVENRCIDPGRLEIGGTCGCPEDRSYTKRLNYKSIADNAFTNFLESNMMEDLTGAKDLTTLLGCIQYYLYLVNDWKDFYLCLNENWLTADKEDHLISEKPFEDQITMYIQSDNRNNRTVRETFALKDFLPALQEEHEEPKAYFITPIHQGLHAFGYVATTFSGNTQLDTSYMNWCRHLSNAIEYFRMHQKIARLAITDSLTGLLTRMGMEQNIGFINLRLCNESARSLLLEIDADGLKTTNDTLGHQAGDVLLRELAKVLKGCLKENELCARVGGDEFIIYGCDVYRDNEIEERIASIEKALDAINQTGQFAFTLSASIGGCLRKITAPEAIQEMTAIADANMYEMKKAHHKNRQ